MQKKNTAENATLAKQKLRDEIERGDLTIGQATRRMRKITGKNQKDYARNIIGISPRVLAEIERDVANPTIATMNKIGRPFGYTAGFVYKKRS